MPKPDFTYFAIFGAMRTGSNLLERSLDSYKGLTARGELFNAVFVGKPAGEPYLGVTLAERNRDPLGYLDAVIANTAGLPGFRIFPGHDARVLDHAARDPHCAKIILRRPLIDSFISLKIATETDQWMLVKEENRRLLKVHFEPEAFEEYKAEMTAHYALIRRKMRLAGQASFEISYDELDDLEMVNGVAAYIGAQERLSSIPQKIFRQNPVALDDRVTNPDDVRAYLAQSGETVTVAARPASVTALPAFVAQDKLVASRGFNLIFAPIPGAGAEAARKLIRNAEKAADVAGKPLANGLTDAHIERRRRRSGFVFSLIRHPALRVLDIFERRICHSGEGAFVAIQSLLIEQYGAPVPSDTIGNDDARGALLDAFIRFIEDNLAGRTSVRQDPSWGAQTALLAAYNAVVPLDFLARSDRAEVDARSVLGRLGVTNGADHIAERFARTVGAKPPSADLITADRERHLLKIYERDYARLGFAPLVDRT